MKLRTRLFVFVAIVFFVMQSASIIWTYYSVTGHVEKVKGQIEEEIRLENEKQVNDYVSFLTLALAEIELRINTLFLRVEEFNWLKKRYAPSVYNFQTNQWGSSVALLTSNQWLDFIQTTVREKLTSCLIMRPPFLHTAYSLNLENTVTLIIEKLENEDILVYIGVPYWSSEISENYQAGEHDILFSIDTLRNNWLLFDAQQLLQLNPEELHARNADPLEGPLSPILELQSKEVYKTLTDSTIKSILAVRQQLIKNPEVLEKARDYGWIKEQLKDKFKDGEKTYSRGLDSCESQICKAVKENERERPWEKIHDWRERDDQNRLIWELGGITGTGLWYFDPFNRFAPKGIVSFPNSEAAKKRNLPVDIGYSVLTKDVFYTKRFPIYANCKPKLIEGEVNTCITPEFDIIFPLENKTAIFLVNTLMYGELEKEQLPDFGTLSLGVNIAPLLEELALISPDRVLFLHEGSDPVMFDTHGALVDIDKQQINIFNQLKGKKDGVITDVGGEEYYFMHVIDVKPNDGHVYIVQYKDSVFREITQLETTAQNFLYSVIIQILILGIILFLMVLILMNLFVKRMLTPITDLVENTQFVATGNLEKIQVSEKDRKRGDEIGTLVKSFEQMVEKMKEGNKVRAVLHKVVNKEVADQILKQGVELGGEVRTVAILFSDIRHFTQISENMPPQDVLAMLNDCLNVLSSVIDDHKAVIDKYVGDAIMAFFGAPVEMENPALQAILCAMAMMRVLREWNRHRESIGYRQLSVGIGIHIGEVIAGNMGAENHLNYTVLGHNVNLASRLCDHAGEMEILITEETLNYPGVKSKIEFETAPEATFKGISHPIAIFRVKY